MTGRVPNIDHEFDHEFDDAMAIANEGHRAPNAGAATTGDATARDATTGDATARDATTGDATARGGMAGEATGCGTSFRSEPSDPSDGEAGGAAGPGGGEPFDRAGPAAAVPDRSLAATGECQGHGQGHGQGQGQGQGHGHRHRAPGALSWQDARSIAAHTAAGARPVEVRPLGDALGQVLAEPLAALTDLPSFDTSAMDGWALAGPGPWLLTASPGPGILAGHAEPAPLPDGRAVRIATGARVPAGTTAVLRSEHGDVRERGLERDRGGGGGSWLYTTADSRAVAPGQDIRPRGQECRSGDRLLPSATLITPAVLGLAAAGGYDELPIVSRPRVEILVLGDELLSTGLPREGLVRDALGPMLGPWLRALGAEVTGTRQLGDDADTLHQAVTASEADVIVTTGGTASGPVDHVHPILRRVDAELLVDGVAVRPGHPMLLARLGPGKYLVGLPGNPLAAVSGLLTLAEPLLRKLAGRSAYVPVSAPLSDRLSGHPRDTRLVPVAFRADEAVPLHFDGPAMLRGIATADGLAVVPPGGAEAGTEAEILELPWYETGSQMAQAPAHDPAQAPGRAATPAATRSARSATPGPASAHGGRESQ